MKALDSSLWEKNHPRHFWKCQPDLSDEIWEKAIAQSLPVLGQSETKCLESTLELTLGEGQFGPNRYNLGITHRAYYHLKPFMPRALTRLLRKLYGGIKDQTFLLGWPIEERFVHFLWEILRRAILLSEKREIKIRNFWPERNRFAFILTHDVESASGQKLIPRLADFEERLGFRSSFNFVADLYHIDKGLIAELSQRGFEVGVHGLKHDGKLFNSLDLFNHRARQINRHLADNNAVGFRSPLTIRQPEWMQALDIEYDLSFFDTDPFEPIPGGTMSIWPFYIGHFVELPYTLVQDYTLTAVLGESTPRLWLEKVNFIEKYFGMALINSHPDYMSESTNWDVYQQFLLAMKERSGYWQALPRDVARWWKKRALHGQMEKECGENYSTVSILNGNIQININA